jgi:hypothetical protein
MQIRNFKFLNIEKTRTADSISVFPNHHKALEEALKNAWFHLMPLSSCRKELPIPYNLPIKSNVALISAYYKSGMFIES